MASVVESSSKFLFFRLGMILALSISERRRKNTMRRQYSKAAQKTVESAMHREKQGTLRSGRSGKQVTNPKQAIAIGLSEARQKGERVPPRRDA
jgi:hypothetical protein